MKKNVVSVMIAALVGLGTMSLAAANEAEAKTATQLKYERKGAAAKARTNAKSAVRRAQSKAKAASKRSGPRSRGRGRR
jgi:hypothetical protein